MSDNSNPSLLVNTLAKDNITVVSFPSTLKLTATNYLGWKTQIEALLQGLDLYRFIDGTHLAPEPTVAADGSITPHIDYPKWFRHDRLLFSALVGSLAPQIVPLLQYGLKKLTKTPDQNITVYMQNVKTIVDELAILGKKLDQEDRIDVVLSGLDQSTYKPILDVVHTRDSTITFNDLHEKLINHELNLAQQALAAGIHQPVTTFYANNQSTRRFWPPRQDTNNTGILPNPSKHNPQAAGSRPFLGKCQWCQSSTSSCDVHSSTEAEFRAVAFATTEVQWLTSLFSELGLSSTTVLAIYCDNLSATSYSANPVFHSRMKHLALDFHFVREKVQQGTLRVEHIAGDDQLADALTKTIAKTMVPLPDFQDWSPLRIVHLEGDIKNTSLSTLIIHHVYFT
ncbi:hypothetical protein LXL04_017873 [Taraxacum kok-saghyz]